MIYIQAGASDPPCDDIGTFHNAAVDYLPTEHPYERGAQLDATLYPALVA